MLVGKKQAFLAFFLSVFAVHAEAKTPYSIRKLRPNWVKPHSWVSGLNRSYLDCFKCDVRNQLPKSFVEAMLDPKLVEGYRADFYVYQNQIEQKKNFGLLSTPKSFNQLELAKFDPNGAKVVNVYDRNQSLTMAIKNRMLDDGMDSQIQDIQNGPAARAMDETASSLGKIIKGMNQGQSKSEPSVSKYAPKPQVKSVASKSAPVLTPQKIDWIDAKFGAKSDFEGMRGQVFMKSKLINTEVDVVASKPLTESVNMGYLGSKIISKMSLGNGIDRQNTETARFRLYRDIPLVNVHASWMYGLSSQTMTSSLSKYFTSFLRAEVTRVDNLNGLADQRAGVFLERTF